MVVRLFALPAVARELVFRFFDVTTLFHISLISHNDFTTLIARVRTIEKLRLEVWLTGRENIVSIFTCPLDCSCRSPVFVWKFDAEQLSEENLERPVVTRRIQGFPVQMRNTGEGRYHTARPTLLGTARDERQTTAVIKHLLNIFPRMDVSEVYIWNDRGGGLANALNTLRNVEELTLDGHVRTPNATFKYFFENINVSKRFIMLSRPDNSFICPEEKTFDCDSIVIQSAHFLLPIHLLTMKCVGATLSNAMFSDDTLLAFIRNWWNSDAGDVRLRKMSIGTRRRRQSPLELAEFDAKEFDEEKRGRFFKLSDENRLDCLNGMDIQRRSDGLLATVVTNINTLFFVVWHDKFPDTSDCTETIRIV